MSNELEKLVDLKVVDRVVSVFVKSSDSDLFRNAEDTEQVLDDFFGEASFGKSDPSEKFGKMCKF